MARLSIRSDSRSPTQSTEIEQERRNSRTRLRKPSAPDKDIIIIEREKRDSIDSGRSFRSHQIQSRTQSLTQEAWDVDRQTGERKDHTALLHSLVDQEEFKAKPITTIAGLDISLRLPGASLVSCLTPDLWKQILEYATPAEMASLAFTCKAFQNLLGPDTWKALNLPENSRDKINFLVHLDESLPNHLLCFPCAIYHVRSQKGQEMLKPSNISNPLFHCPNASNPNKKQSRIRLTMGRTLPFTFVQLALRAHRYSPDYGIPVDSLSRRYKDRPETNSTWSHQTRYAIMPADNHLVLRVVSTCFATPALPPAGLRHLLYSREDFIPYFSVCPHWRDGELMPSVKCALSHIPKPIEGSGIDRVVKDINHHFQTRKSSIVSLCSDCKPMRRCPRCPTEYLIEMKVMEDRSDPARVKSDPNSLFKQALVVTRWSDLGEGSTPWASPEWAACADETPESGIAYDSFKLLGRRAVSGEFEALFNPDIVPGQRLVSLNPNNENLGEAGHRWY